MRYYDKLFINGEFHTMESKDEVFTTLGIKDGLISYVGDNTTLNADETIDLMGKTVIPGMADAHMHMYAYCQNLVAVDLSDVRSIEEMISVMKNRAEETPEGMWIKGVNFDQTLFKEKRMPTRDDLDKISTKHPITIRRVCLHAIVVNSLGLSIAGVGVGYKPEGGGVVEVEEDGTPNGVLREQCTQVIDNVIKDPLKDPSVKEKVMLEVFKDMTEKGITTIHTYSAKIWNYEESIETYKDLEKRGILPVRVTVCLDELFETPKGINNDPNVKVQMGSYKLFTDGSLGANSAALREPYEDSDELGVMICTEEDLYDRMKTAFDKGLQPAIHAIGDRALEITLNCIEKTLANSDKDANLPFRIIHAQMTPPDLIERMKKLPVVLDIQPVFLRTDLHWIEEKLGKDRAKDSYMWKTLMENGLIETGGSDCPVESYNPINGIYSAVTRCDYEGFPLGGYNPEEKVDVFDAVAMFTKNPHYATGQEDINGMLKNGYFADFVVLDRNIFEIDEMDILNVKVEATYLAGNKVY
ncbi:MAG TPA: amidohydrolase [Anaerovoracaceae bacterium]|nr:amidohydrolase [Anaerovoracaceae bacterium]